MNDITWSKFWTKRSPRRFGCRIDIFRVGSFRINRSVFWTRLARVAVRLASVPPALEDAQRRLEQTNVAINILKRESAVSADHGERLAELAESKAAAEAEVQSLGERWEKERALIGQIREMREKLGGGVNAPPKAAAALSPRRTRLRARLRARLRRGSTVQDIRAFNRSGGSRAAFRCRT